MFYFKSRDHWSEPAGVIVIEGCQVRADVNPLESTFGILLVFGGGKTTSFRSTSVYFSDPEIYFVEFW